MHGKNKTEVEHDRSCVTFFRLFSTFLIRQSEKVVVQHGMFIVSVRFATKVDFRQYQKKRQLHSETSTVLNNPSDHIVFKLEQRI